jgi:A/G-specific adenine glycosylase
MLQQTQVATVIPFFERFLARFPDAGSLAAAPLEEVLRHWSGLGYYSRARNLHRCAVEVAARPGGRFPDRAEALAKLPGIGRSTAAAIAAFCFGERAAILDGNVKRVLCRVFGIEGSPTERAVEQRLWQIAERELPESGVAVHTQALMDLGATVCTRSRPRCTACPLADRCVAALSDRVASLPAPRPRRASPWRGALLLVLRDVDAVRVVRRPSPGIWGGLWSVPEIAIDAPDGRIGAAPEALAEDHAAAIAAIACAHGATVRGVRALPAFTHAFTHYRLRAQPVLVEVGSVRGSPAPAPGLWLPLSEVAGAALPRPVKTLLTGLVPG